MAEHSIYLLKRKLYMILRSEKSLNWPKYLPIAVALLNKRPMKRLGYLTPGSINSMIDDISVRRAQEEKCVDIYQHPSYKEQNLAQAEYEKTSGFQKDNFVYLDYKEKTFAKSFDAKISQPFCPHYSSFCQIPSCSVLSQKFFTVINFDNFEIYNLVFFNCVQVLNCKYSLIYVLYLLL